MMLSLVPFFLLSSVEATEISAVTQNRTNTSRNIYWAPVKYGKCNMHYVVKLYSGDELLLSDITDNTLYSFNSKHMNVTSFRIWAEMGKEPKYSLPDKEEGKITFSYFAFQVISLAFSDDLYS